MGNFLRRRAARRLWGELEAAGYKDLEASDVVQHLDLVLAWSRGGISSLELGAHTGWGERGNHTLVAAKAFQDAKYELGAGMVRDYRAGRSEDEIVKQAAFTLPVAEGRKLFHASRLMRDALDVLAPWMREPDGPIVLFPVETKAAEIAAVWEKEDENTRRRLLGGLDEALRAAGIGYRDRKTKAPLCEEHLAQGDERLFTQLYFLATPDLVESVDV
ncbi:hypothetical protein [Streptomyces sp. NPDC058268]|uniref:hypothetical protein n=1 Tax=Streptomyces sp. NPDC058268 TaxID=3346413 RepID=UPI0036F0E236